MANKMQIGFNLPISGPLAAPEIVARIAQEGEALGYDYMTFTDHVVLPDRPAPGYPYSESGEFYGHGPEVRHEQMTVMAWVAAKTQRIRLVSAILVVPHRPAVLAAKQLATIDVLSNGRLTVGVGAGWLKAEFDAVVTTPYAERGAVTDEYIQAFRTLWTEKQPKLDGKYTRIDGISFEPKPVQKPHPPIWVGGESAPSMRRAAKFGDAWYPIGSNQKSPLDTLARYRAGIGRVRQLTAEAGRDPASLQFAYRVKRYGDTVPPTGSDGTRSLFSGGDSQIVDDFKALADLGVGIIDIDFERPEAGASMAEMRRFRDEVLTKTGL
jgi:probable F420-dependent oxidoreductase